MAHIPVTVTSTLTSTKLIKTANKPWLLGHIKPNNADRVGSTVSEREREVAIVALSVPIKGGLSVKVKVEAFPPLWQQILLICLTDMLPPARTDALRVRKVEISAVETSLCVCMCTCECTCVTELKVSSELIFLVVVVTVISRADETAGCLLLMHYISITFGLLGISTTILMTVLRVFPGS